MCEWNRTLSSDFSVTYEKWVKYEGCWCWSWLCLNHWEASIIDLPCIEYYFSSWISKEVLQCMYEDIAHSAGSIDFPSLVLFFNLTSIICLAFVVECKRLRWGLQFKAASPAAADLIHFNWKHQQLLIWLVFFEKPSSNFNWGLPFYYKNALLKILLRDIWVDAQHQIICC